MYVLTIGESMLQAIKADKISYPFVQTGLETGYLGKRCLVRQTLDDGSQYCIKAKGLGSSSQNTDSPSGAAILAPCNADDDTQIWNIMSVANEFTAEKHYYTFGLA